MKKLTLENMTKEDEPETTTKHQPQDSAIMICYRECLTNLEKFNGNEETKTVQFINNIERIGRMIKANDDILHCMCIAKLDGEAKRWYENNTSLTEWRTLKCALVERFTSSDLTSRTFEQLKQRKQQPNESITSYYDDIIKLCHEYDSGMSQRMMISWLENGINESLKIPVKRQMKTLPELARTTKAFLKIAKDEEELQESASTKLDSTSSYVPYFTNTVSTTLMRPENRASNQPNYDRPPIQPTTDRRSNSQHQQSSSRNYHCTTDQRSSPNERKRFSYRPDYSTSRTQGTKPSYRSNMTNRKFNRCIICGKENHRTIDCYQKKETGCYKCGQSDHRVRDCPTVFY